MRSYSLSVLPNDELRMEKDGDLVFYKISFDGIIAKSVWTSNTKGRGSYVILENDGNLVIYDDANNKVWETKQGF